VITAQYHPQAIKVHTEAENTTFMTAPAFLYQCRGVVLSVPEALQPFDIIRAVQELQRMALEDYLRRTADGGGT
jgi:hypothetical protein